MTRTTAVLALMLAAASASAAPVPENPPAAQAAAPADAETLHKELRTLRDTMQNALNKRDLAALLDNVTDDVVFTTMNGDRVIGKEGVRAYYEKMLGGSGAVVKNIETHFEADALSHLYADTAVAFGHSSDRYELAGGEVWEVSPQWSAAIVRRDGTAGWWPVSIIPSICSTTPCFRHSASCFSAAVRQPCWLRAASVFCSAGADAERPSENGFSDGLCHGLCQQATAASNPTACIRSRFQIFPNSPPRTPPLF
ncbi:YybH family protein [Kingella potus]|uniref:YybH family protein n=1 Tax=Kingella potus TaxID=265175 RepID=UPI001FD3CF46|nr:nuclear transport factor 2 family protein [Kingella potus]UOP01471.1 nuclear transport factor 2 family protein [Kingella potus]